MTKYPYRVISFHTPPPRPHQDTKRLRGGRHLPVSEGARKTSVEERELTRVAFYNS